MPAKCSGPSLRCSELRLCRLAKACAVLAALSGHNLSAEELWCVRPYGDGSPEIAVQGARLDGSEWSRRQRAKGCAKNLRSLGTLLRRTDRERACRHLEF